jgi:hypothetical protein
VRSSLLDAILDISLTSQAYISSPTTTYFHTENICWLDTIPVCPSSSCSTGTWTQRYKLNLKAANFENRRSLYRQAQGAGSRVVTRRFQAMGQLRSTCPQPSHLERQPRAEQQHQDELEVLVDAPQRLHRRGVSGTSRMRKSNILKPGYHI